MSGFLDRPAPRWFTIAAHRPFLDDLAGGIWRELAPLGPEALSRAVVLVPNRRAARDLSAAFVRFAGGGPVMPPQMRALGDLDEGEAPFEPGDVALDLPAAIGAARRRFELAALVVAHEECLERKLDARAALDLADALAAFLDSLAIEEVGEGIDIEALAEGDLARHWRRTADFLQIALEAWPKRLADLGVMDIAARRVALLRRLRERWSEAPPGEILIAAGSTGSTPATADLLAAVAAAPRGAVVLPGLDLSLADEAWVQVGEEHPQGALRRLLARAGVERGEVAPWDGASEGVDAGRWRRRLINEALRPPVATADWLEVIEGLRQEGPIEAALEGLALAAARDEEEAAALAAVLMREALETPGRTAALVTADSALARRVSARLTRWNITADSSVGVALAEAPAAVLCGLVARARGPADPVNLLAILKHPFTRLGLAPETLGRGRERLERYGLRGPRPDGWDGLAVRLGARLSGEDLAAGLDMATRLRAALAGLDEAFCDGAAAPAHGARALAGALDSLAAGPAGEPGALWSGQAGTLLGALLTQLLEDSGSLPPVTRDGFAELVDALMAGEVIRPGGASHPRLQILGVLEARFVRADLMILAGLEEGVWPASPSIDPFLSRPMRARLGLPAPERRIGLAAHDFAQSACAAEVVLIHAERRGGAPAVESRWLWRLRTLMAGAKLAPPGRPEALAWARGLDAPLSPPPPSLRTASRPCPRPPVEVRPRSLPVTEIERWVRDPYSVYARRILGLRPLDIPDAPVEALARGSAIHRAFERFARDYPGAIPDGAEALFEAMILEELHAAGMPTAPMVRERALARNVAPWVMDLERRRRPGARLHVEQTGEHVFATKGGGNFKLTARADRLEERDGEVDVIDFKTGRIPSGKMVEAHLSPQLTLTAAILAAGGFAGLGKLRPRELIYIRVSGGRVPGSEEPRGGDDAAALAQAALAGLKRRVAAFDEQDTPYLSRAAPQFMGDAGDFDQLARLWEWHVIGDEEAAE